MLNKNLTQSSRKNSKKSILSFYNKINMELTNSQLDCIENFAKKDIVLSGGMQCFFHSWEYIAYTPSMMASEFGANSTVLFIINDKSIEESKLGQEI